MTTNTVTRRTDAGFDRITALGYLAPGVRHTGPLVSRIGYYGGVRLPLGLAVSNEREQDLDTTGPGLFSGLEPEAGLRWLAGGGVALNTGVSYWIPRASGLLFPLSAGPALHLALSLER